MDGIVRVPCTGLRVPFRSDGCTGSLQLQEGAVWSISIGHTVGPEGSTAAIDLMMARIGRVSHNHIHHTTALVLFLSFDCDWTGPALLLDLVILSGRCEKLPYLLPPFSCVQCSACMHDDRKSFAFAPEHMIVLVRSSSGSPL